MNPLQHGPSSQSFSDSLSGLINYLQLFEQAWKEEGAPDILEFLASSASDVTEAGARQQLLEELVKIDLEYRWRPDGATKAESAFEAAASKLPTRPMLEDYLALYPELSPSGQPSLSLVEEEYRVRCRWGDRPDHGSYEKRFPSHSAELTNYLHDVDQELLREEPPQQPSGQESARAATTDDVGRAPALSSAVNIPDFEIMAELGRGGMGVVYKARQKSANRMVALKVVGTDRLSNLAPEERRRTVQRFLAEGQAAAQLEHDNIVKVYQVGESLDQPYYAMRYVEGASLADLIKTAPLEPRRAAGYVAQVARGLHEGHRSGVLHRDVKPQNVMVDAASDRPMVVDYGLAKLTQGDQGHTATGDLMGTPEYMSPDQAQSAAKITVASDVYSLGATLYALLTGRPPFKGETRYETLRQVIEKQPTPPTKVRPGIPRDLETICLKCLEKASDKRYASALALAEDLDNWLEARPINARPVSNFERFWRWCRRNPAWTAAACLVLAIIGVAFGLITVSRNEAVALAAHNAQLAGANGQLADEKTQLADEKTRLAGEKSAEAARASDEAKKARIAEDTARAEKARAERESTLLIFQQARILCEQGELDRGMHLFARGLSRAKQTGTADLEQLCRLNLTAWGARLHALDAILPQPAGVSAVAYSPDGRTIATSTWKRSAQLWDLKTATPRGSPFTGEDWIHDLVFSPDGAILAVVDAKRIQLWNTATGKQLGALTPAAPAPGSSRTTFTSAAFSPDGRFLLTGSFFAGAQVWDVAAQKPVADPLVSGWIEAVAVSPNGKLLVTGSKFGEVVLWDAETRKPTGKLRFSSVSALAISLDSQVLLVGGEDGQAHLWDLREGRSLGIALQHQAAITSVAFSPDGSLALTGSSDRTARIWEVKSSKPIGQPLRHAEEVVSVAFSVDGLTVLTGQGRKQGDARLWRLAVGDSVCAPLVHQESVVAATMSSDGKRVATASHDETGQLWEVPSGARIGDQLRHGHYVNAVAFSPDGEDLVSAGDDSHALFWHAATGRPIVQPSIFDKKVFHQRMVAPRDGLLGGGPTLGASPWAEWPGRELWGPARGKRSGERAGGGSPMHVIAYSPDGEMLATGSRHGAVDLWDAKGRWVGPKKSLRVKTDKAPAFAPRDAWADYSVYALAYSPKGDVLAEGRGNKLARLWNVETGQPLHELPHESPVVALAFSPDGKLLLTGGGDSEARLWNVTTGKLVHTLRHHAPVVSLAFSPCGARMLTGSWDRSARLWETATGAPIGEPMLHKGKVLAVAFDPLGRMVLTGSEDWTAQLWDAGTGRPVGPSFHHRDQVRTVSFGPQGKLALTGSDDRTAQLWAVPALLDGDADRLAQWLEAHTATCLDAVDSIHLLDKEAWQALPMRRTAFGGGFPDPGERLGWHRQQAAASADAGRWLAVRWHMDRLVAAAPDDWRLRLRRGDVLVKLAHLPEAQEDFDRAVELAPQEPAAWHQRGRCRGLAGAWPQSLEDLTKALDLLEEERRPQKDVVYLPGAARQDDARLWHSRGLAYAELSEWDKAAEDLRRSVSVYGSTMQMRADHATICLKLGEAKTYRSACLSLLKVINSPDSREQMTVVSSDFGHRAVYRFGAPFNVEAAAQVVWTCALVQDAVPDSMELVKLAQRAAKIDPQDYLVARSLGAALYRAGQHREAVEQLQAAQALRKSPAPSVWVLLAMAHHHMGDMEKAGHWLDRATAWLEDARKKPADAKGPLWSRLRWTERLALETLHREAAMLIEKKDAP